jgi:multidrug efflux system membrane fusion protein
MKRPKIKARLLATLAVTTALILLAGCSGGKKGAAPPVVPVTAAQAQRKDVPQILSAIGSVEPYTSVGVKAQVGGELQRVHFQEGQDVRKGDPLFTIDPRPYQAALRQAEANLARDKAQAQSAEANANRFAELVKKDYVTRQDYDNAVAQAESLKASVKADEAAADNARLNLAYCTIRAPMDCRTSNLLVQQGNLIKANDVPLVVLNQITPIFVAFSVPEHQLLEVQRAFASGKVPVTAQPDGGKATEGELVLVNNQVDSSTGMVLLKAVFPNADKVLWPGQFVNVAVTLSTIKDAVVVPPQAVQPGQKGDYVFVVDKEMAVQMRPVTVGQKDLSGAVILSGLQPGETVVTDGQLRLFPGAKVEIKKSMDESSGSKGQGSKP